MRNVDARVTGFDYTTFHTYTTEVEVDGRTWTLNIRYNTFYQFYERVLALEKYFTVGFPPKGGLFFSPPPEERQEQLDEFILSTLAYFDMRGHPRRMEALLDELFQISEHLGVKDEEERTASEGSFEEHEDYLHEDEDVATKVDPQGLKSEADDEVQAHDAMKIDSVELETKLEAVEGNEVKRRVQTKSKVPDGQQQLTGGVMAIEDIAMQRFRTLLNRAVQTAVVSSMTENADKSKAAKVEKITEEQQSAKKDKATEVEVGMQQKEAAVVEVEEKSATQMVKKTAMDEESAEAALVAQAAIETTGSSTEPEEHVLEPVASTDKLPDTAIELDAVSILAPKFEEKPGKVNEASLEKGSEEPDLEPCKKELESKNPMVGWLRRIITFGPSLDKTEEQEAVQKQEEEEEDVEAVAQAETEATEAEACTKAEELAKAEALEAELLLAAQELNLRLQRYRYPVFFRSFIYDVGTSRFALSQRLSSGIVV